VSEFYGKPVSMAGVHIGEGFHTLMDLQGIGAVAAVPTTVVVGVLAWWGASTQAKGAAETGREQARSALIAAQEQAQSAYQAALDAVREQARTDHRHWRSNLRRDTWAAFLLAVSRYDGTAVELHELRDEDRVPEAQRALDKAQDALAEAFAIVELEGPQEMVAKALALFEAVTRRAEQLSEVAPLHRATHAFNNLLDQEQTIVPTLDGGGCHHPGHDADDALLALARLWDDIPDDQWERSLTDRQWEAIDAAGHAVQDALNACPSLSPEHSRALIDIYSRSRRDWRSAEDHTDAALRRVVAARECFVVAAREELSGG
jgi:hypothetical protein